MRPVQQAAPDVVLLYLNMPGMSGVDTLRRIKALDPYARILIFSPQNDPRVIQRVLKAGASGYLDKKNSQLLADEVRRVARGEMPWA